MSWGNVITMRPVLMVCDDMVAARASLPLSWNNAATAVAFAAAIEQFTVTEIRRRLAASVGVIAKVMYSSPSLLCGMLSSGGITVDPDDTAPVCVLTICTTTLLPPVPFDAAVI